LFVYKHALNLSTTVFFVYVLLNTAENIKFASYVLIGYVLSPSAKR